MMPVAVHLAGRREDHPGAVLTGGLQHVLAADHVGADEAPWIAERLVDVDVRRQMKDDAVVTRGLTDRFPIGDRPEDDVGVVIRRDVQQILLAGYGEGVEDRHAMASGE